jgi:6-phosphogluconolactonase
MRHDHRFASASALAEGLATHLASVLKNDIASRGRASLIVSGGRTPAAMFEALSGQELKWEQVDVTLADERLVPPDHPESNAGFVRRHLQKGRAAAMNFVPLWTGEGDPATGARSALAHLVRPFTSVVLGMGEDGHTASLFPGMPELAAALDPLGEAAALAVPAAGDRAPRLSLTIRTLLDASGIALSFTGDAKRAVFDEAMREGPVEAMPVRAILRQATTPLDVYWSP